MVSMPQISIAIGEQESGARFVGRVEDDVNLLVGNYSIAEHKEYQELGYG
jgi:hypothetical protein